MDYDDDADGIADIDDGDPLDPNTDYDGDGLTDGYETQVGLNPYDNSDSETDSDNDGLRDSLELAWNLNPYDVTDGAIVDSDGDGFINEQEISANTDPLDPNAYDGDLDGVHGIYDLDDNDPFSDSDFDTIADIVETQYGLNPLDGGDVDLNIDSDNDGMADILETMLGLNVGVDDSLDDLDGDGMNNITEVNNRTVANDPNDPVYNGHLDADNDTIVNGIDTDLDGNNIEDTLQDSFPVLSSSVVSGIGGTVLSESEFCDDGPSEDDKHEAIYLVDAESDSTSSNACYKHAGSSSTNYTVATTVNPDLSGLPHYRISPAANPPVSRPYQTTKMYIKGDPANYILYQVVRVNNDWVYGKVMDIAQSSFDLNGFTFIDHKFNELTADIEIVMVPVGTDMSGVTVDPSSTHNTFVMTDKGDGSEDPVLVLVDPVAGSYIREGILKVGSAKLPGDMEVSASDVTAYWPSGQATSGCDGLNSSEYAHTLQLAVGADHSFTNYGCYSTSSYSYRNYYVTVFLANLVGEGVYPMYDISVPANSPTSSYDNKTYIYLQLASNEAHTLYQVASDYS
ncbi:hypothetical protein UB34_20600, partial [Photobacterium leiognathi]